MVTTLIIILLFLIVLVLVVGWFVYCVSMSMLMFYMQDKGCPLPSDEEIKVYLHYALKKLLHIH